MSFFLLCKSPWGMAIVSEVTPLTTLKELKKKIGQMLQLKPDHFDVLHGSPRRTLRNSGKTLIDLEVYSGSTIHLHLFDQVTHQEELSERGPRRGTETTPACSFFGMSSIRPPTSTDVSGNEFSLPPSSCTQNVPMETSDDAEVDVSPPFACGPFGRKSLVIPTLCEKRRFKDRDSKLGHFVRISIPADNSCLFSSFSIAALGLERNQDSPQNLRDICSSIIAEDTVKYNAAFLGMSNADYSKWIREPRNWGGAIELSILSEEFHIEIVVIHDKDSLTLKFGEGQGYEERIIFCYNGAHYEPVCLLFGNIPYTIFKTSDHVLLDKAIQFSNIPHMYEW